MFFSSFVFIFYMGRHLCWSFDDFLGFPISSAENHSVFVFYPKPISSTNISLHAHKFDSAPVFPEQWSSKPDNLGHFWAGLSRGQNIQAKLRPNNPALRSVHIKRGNQGELLSEPVLPPPTPSLFSAAAWTSPCSPTPPQPLDPANLSASCSPSPREQVPPSSSSNG
jgi:hypothetical protein